MMKYVNIEIDPKRAVDCLNAFELFFYFCAHCKRKIVIKPPFCPMHFPNLAVINVLVNILVNIESGSMLKYAYFFEKIEPQYAYEKRVFISFALLKRKKRKYTVARQFPITFLVRQTFMSPPSVLDVVSCVHDILCFIAL